MTGTIRYNPRKAVESRYPYHVKNMNASKTQMFKRHLEDELTASSTVTPSSLLSSATNTSNPHALDVLDRKVVPNSRIRIIDLAERCPSAKSRTKRPGIQEEDNESTIAPCNVSYKRISPDTLPEPSCIVDLQQQLERQAMLDYRREHREAFRRAVSMLHTGNAAVQRDQHDEAIPILERAAETFGVLQKAIARARCLDLLGQACSNSARWNESISHLFEAFLIREGELGPTHVDTIDTLKHLGEVFLCSGNARQARNCFAKVFWIHRELFGTEHCCVARDAHNLANAFDAEDDLLQAEIFYRTSLEIYRKAGAPDNSPIIQGLLSDLRRVESP